MEQSGVGLAFDCLADDGAAFQETPQVITGHARGLITINMAEADDAERERARKDMAEPYRTLLGHFRDEVGRYCWKRLVRDGVWPESFHELFGDERQDYGACIEAHHAGDPPERFVSGYRQHPPVGGFRRDLGTLSAHRRHTRDRRRLRFAHRLHGGTHSWPHQAPPPGAGVWLGASLARRRHDSPMQERDRPLQRVLAVALLAP